MGGTIFTNSNGIVYKNPRHGIELSKSGYTDGRMEVINKHSEGGYRDLEESMV